MIKFLYNIMSNTYNIRAKLNILYQIFEIYFDRNLHVLLSPTVACLNKA